jgi:hypothetical protein
MNSQRGSRAASAPLLAWSKQDDARVTGPHLDRAEDPKLGFHMRLPRAQIPPVQQPQRKLYVEKLKTN